MVAENETRRIGVFDSGVGGLTVFRELRAHLPDADLVYLGDTARTPYGSKSKNTIIRYALECADFLIRRHHVQELVVACNTVSSYALEELRAAHPKIPVYGTIEPAVETALRAHDLAPQKQMLVLGTKATVNSQAFIKVLHHYCTTQTAAHKTRALPSVAQQACPLFVPLVEEGLLAAEVTTSAIEHYLGAHRKAGDVGVVILGCTHYPVLQRQLGQFFGNEVTLVDCALALAQKVAATQTQGHPETPARFQPLQAKSTLPNSIQPLMTTSSCSQFFCTDDPAAFAQLAQTILQESSVVAERVMELAA